MNMSGNSNGRMMKAFKMMGMFFWTMCGMYGMYAFISSMFKMKM